jgi:hypothetical protein
MANDEPLVSSNDHNDVDGFQVHQKRKKRVYTSLFTKQAGLSQEARERMEDSPFSVRSEQQGVTASIDGPLRRDKHEKSKRNAADSDKQILDLDMEMEAIMNDSNTNRPQPTSKSDLSSARAFFRFLDNQNLTILNRREATTPKSKNDVIRTLREIEHCEQVREEYALYCKSNTGVVPISLSEFASHWNLYFTEKGVVRDGLLDED